MSLLTEDQRMLIAAARELLADKASSVRLRSAAESCSGHDTDLWTCISELGWTALPLPEKLGGLASGLPDLAGVIEECGRVLMPSPLTASSAVSWLLARYPDLGQPALDLSAFATGARIATWSLHTLDGTGTLTGRPAAERRLRVSGTRRHLSDGGVATDAMLDVNTSAGPCLILLPLDQPGVSRRMEGTLDLTRGYAEVGVVDVEVSSDRILPPHIAAELRRCGVVLQCAESVGVAARALQMTLEHVRQRCQFDRPIGSFQAVKHRVADTFIELQGARVATRDAAEAVQLARSDADFAVHTAKSWTGRAASMITSEAVQLHGGIGFTWEYDLHLLQRRAKANELLHGSPGWHEEQLVELLRPDRVSPAVR